MQDFRKLEVWKKSMTLAKLLYQLADSLPSKEKFGLSSQITRAAVSIPSNIAEGCSRSGAKEFKRFLEIALGSAYELETQLLLIQALFNKNDTALTATLKDVKEVQKMLHALILKVRKA